MTLRKLGPQHLKEVWGVEVKPSFAGEGLFAARDFIKGENIVPYLGQVILFMEPDSDDEERKKPNEYEGDYVLQLTKSVFIDAARTDSEGRYVNAPPKGKKSNAQFVYDKKNKVAWVRANKNIKEGKEILAAYGKAYWRGKKKQ